MSTNKKELRAVMKARREQITNKAEKDRLITNLFLDLAKGRNYDGYFTYLSIGSEADTFNIISKLLKKGDRVCIPYTNGGVMSVKELKFLPETVVLDKLGNLSGAETLKIAEKQCGCAIVPMLAFNSRLYRLGYGGGYYDKYLQSFNGEKIGLAYSVQKNDALLPEDFDIPLDAVITENGIIERS